MQDDLTLRVRCAAAHARIRAVARRQYAASH
jgi:hypothetical protein